MYIVHTYYYSTAFRHRRPFNRVYYLPRLIYRVYNILTAYPQTAYLVHNRVTPEGPQIARTVDTLRPIALFWHLPIFELVTKKSKLSSQC